VMVILIVVFVLLTPKRWFHDQPQTVAIPSSSVQMIGEDTSSRTRTYRIDVALLAPGKRSERATPELERQTHDILGQSVDELRGQSFQIRQINPVRAENGAVAFYDVTIHP